MLELGKKDMGISYKLASATNAKRDKKEESP
jgi:hypothetical protein